jgi:hypothetical protein
MKCFEGLTLLQIKFRIRLQSFERKIENKTHLHKRSLVDQEQNLPWRCRPHKWFTPGGRERTHLQNNIKAKPNQL